MRASPTEQELVVMYVIRYNNEAGKTPILMTRILLQLINHNREDGNHAGSLRVP